MSFVLRRRLIITVFLYWAKTDLSSTKTWLWSPGETTMISVDEKLSAFWAVHLIYLSLFLSWQFLFEKLNETAKVLATRLSNGTQKHHHS